MKLFNCISRSLAGCCPKCNHKTLMRNRFRINEICSYCGVKFLENPGDSWGFLLLLDRALFIFPIIVIYYLLIDTISALTAVSIGVIFMVIFILMTPQRIGVSMAIEYWIREGRKNE